MKQGNKNMSKATVVKTVKVRKVGRPALNISRDALRKAVKGCQSTSRVAACYEVGNALGCSWLSVFKAAKAKGVRLPLGKRGRPALSKASTTAQA
jgi:hypothetical protein